MIPWWLRPTKAGRFYARHKSCTFRQSHVLGNMHGYYTYTECTNWEHYGPRHRERLYEDTGYPLAPYER